MQTFQVPISFTSQQIVCLIFGKCYLYLTVTEKFITLGHERFTWGQLRQIWRVPDTASTIHCWRLINIFHPATEYEFFGMTDETSTNSIVVPFFRPTKMFLQESLSVNRWFLHIVTTLVVISKSDHRKQKRMKPEGPDKRVRSKHESNSFVLDQIIIIMQIV